MNYRNKQRNKNIMKTLTLTQMESAKALLGTDVNELEFAEHIVIENGNTYFQLIHLNGTERLALVSDFI